jgi:signal transduction histidine kinase
MWGSHESAFLESALRVLRDGLLIVNGAGNIYYANPRAQDFIGIPNEPVKPGLHPGSLRRFAPDIFSHFQPSADNTPRIANVGINYPEHRLLRVTFLPFDPVADLHALVLSDITAESEERKATLEQETCAAIELLAGGIAHEIGNPINTLKIHLQLLGRKLAQSAKTQPMVEHTKVCLQELDRMDHIIKCFLHAVRPLTPQFRELLLSQCLENCHRILSEELKALNIRFSLKIDSAAKESAILGDDEQLQQAFFNILRNAMEAMDGGGKIQVTVISSNQQTAVDICDNGVGISSEALSRILNPYYTTKATGNGLGLMIVQRILRAHRATFSVESRQPHGTRFSIRFPRKDPQFPMLESAMPHECQK